MANYINACATVSHIHTCNLHDDERITKCSGTLRRGGTCTNNAKWPLVAGTMPTCKIHRRQIKMSAWCTALLPCGYECGRLFEWKPHGFHLCHSHLEISTTCYFSNIPIEIRCRIYRFLLPDRAIPARFVSSVYLTTDWGRVYTAILCVNRQIHEEAANFLYSTRLFSVEVSENTMIMCNLPGGDVKYGAALIQERQDPYNSNGESSSHPTHSPVVLTPAVACGPARPVWDPPLSDEYFTAIQSFRIELLFHYPINYKIPGSLASDTKKRRALALRISHYSDQLHRLVERLRLRKNPIARLEITIKFFNIHVESLSLQEAYSASLDLLNPFRRLCEVVRPQVVFITINDSQCRKTVHVFPELVSSPVSWKFANCLKSWAKDLSSSQPSLQSDQVLEAYWKLENLLFSIKERCKGEPRFFQLEELLEAARIEREANHLDCFKKIWDQVVAIWFEYLVDHEGLKSNVTKSINAINDIVS